MPSGYTSDIYEGKDVTFRQFAEKTVRGLGAFYFMRDEPWDAPLPREAPISDYQEKRVCELNKEFHDLLNLSEEQAAEKAKEIFAENAVEDEEYVQRKIDLRKRYEAMLAQVNAWKGAPDGAQKFLADQLQESIDFDCSTSYQRNKSRTPMTGAEYIKAERERILRSLRYAEEDLRKERARHAERNAWIKKFHDSLDAMDPITE